MIRTTTHPACLTAEPARTSLILGARRTYGGRTAYKRQEATQREQPGQVWEHRYMAERMTRRHRHWRTFASALLAAPMSFLHLSLSHTVDITGMATVVLAVGTLILAVSTRRTARATSIQASATRQQSRLLKQQLDLDRRQLAEIHRPVTATTTPEALPSLTSGSGLSDTRMKSMVYSSSRWLRAGSACTPFCSDRTIEILRNS
jgi:hypothetical protein